ncbi:MAG TPA: hypothetical protein VNQ73_07960 [Ilumatobacter sp.]|nr:hypothetical protein [Ilumatobacter sp.]
MNTPDPFRRLRGQLHDASSQVRLTPGSEQATIRAAHRRRNRTRALVGATAAVAVGTGTVVAIQQLGKTSPGQVAFGDGDGVASEDVIVAGSTVVPGLATAPGVAPGSAEWFAGFPATVPAQPAESSFEWAVMSPEAADAVFYRSSGSVPGVVIASAPGTAGGPRAFYTADGNQYEEIALDPPNGDKRWTLADGDTIYSIGTGPGFAPGSPGPLYIDVSPDRGETWSQAQLNEEPDDALPGVRRNYQLSLGLTDAGMLFVVSAHAALDTEQLPGLERGWVGWTEEGLIVPDGDCDLYGPAPTTVVAPEEWPYYPESSSTTTVPGGQTPVSTTPGEVATTTTGMVGACEQGIVSWAELGIPPESAAAITAGVPIELDAYLVVEGQPELIGLPAEAVGGASLGQDGVLHTYGADGNLQGRFELAADRTWQALPTLPFERWTAGPQAETTGGQVVPLNGPDGALVLASSTDGANWTYASTSDIVGTTEQVLFQQFGSTPDALVSVVGRPPTEAPDPADDVVVGGITARWDASTYQWDFFQADGTPVDPATVTLTVNGDIVVNGPEGSPLATFPELAYQRVDEPVEYFVQSTTDGVHVAHDALTELIGMPDAEIGGISPITSMGRLAVIKVHVRDGAGSELTELLLVGTPND